MALVLMTDGMRLLVGRSYLCALVGAEAAQSSRFTAALLASGFRRPDGVWRGSELDPSAFQVTPLESGALNTAFVFQSDHEDSVREARAAIAVAAWQAGAGRPSSVEIHQEAGAPDEPGIADSIGASIGSAVGNVASSVGEVARIPLYLALLGIVGFGIYLYARS